MNRPGLRLLILAFLILLAGPETIASDTKQFVPTAGMKGFELSPRPAPAQVARESEEEMKGKGFARIGTISNWVITATYWGSTDLNVSAPSTRRDLTKEVCEEAAERGGDFVTLTEDNLPIKRHVTKNGKAIRWHTEDRQVTVNIGTVDRPVYKDQWHTTKVADAWEQIPGVQCSVRSSGDVWRNEPDLPRRFAEWRKVVAEREKAERMAARKKETRSVFLRGGDYYCPPRGVYAEGLKPFMNADERVGYADRDGTTVIEPQFLFAENFSDGLAQVLAEGEGTSYIDKTGTRVLVPPSHSWRWGDFREGMARVGVGESYPDQDLKWGYMDTTGKLIIPAQFDDAEDFSEGLARVKIKGASDKWGYIDKKGQYVVPLQFLVAGDFRDGLAPVMPFYRGGKYGYIDPTGKWVIPDTQFLGAREFSEGLAPVEINLGTDKRVNFKWGYIDKQANFVIKAQFDEAFPFSDGMARVVKIKGWDTKKYGFIDRTGRMVVEPVYDKANDFWDGLAVAWPVWQVNLEKWTLKSPPGKILNKEGQIIGVLDVLGTVRWMSKPQGDR